MRLLVDTHVAIWGIVEDPRLTAAASAMLTDPTNTIVISAASIWEIAIKRALDRRGANAMPVSAAEALAYFEASGCVLLPVTPEHARAVEQLPSIHADPFDRLLVAQALTEPMRLMTHDPIVASYSDTIIRV